MKFRYILLASSMLLSFSSCEKFLDRPPLMTLEDNTTGWTSETKVRLYANKFYTDYFEGYGSGFSSGNVPLIGNTNNDDMVTLGSQPNLTRAVPNSAIWNYSNVRSINIMIERVEKRMEGILTQEAQNHWLAVGRFFRACEYAGLVRAYGDVPYINREVKDNEDEELYKARTPRNEVMDAVYEDWRFVLDNLRANDGDQNLNRFIAAGFISRLALIEASWQKYYYNNIDRAKKFYELVVECAQIDMNSAKYDIVTDYKSLFTTRDLKGNKDMVMYRIYDGAQNIRHSIASNSNLQESTNNGPTTDLLKAYLLSDGKTYETSAVTDATKFDLATMIKTRDPRFEATFYSKPNALNRGAMYYITKYLPREVEKAVKVDGQPLPADFAGDKNETDAPVLRYAEVLLNWIEAKAELETLGGPVVSQDDINKSINKIRKRPIAAEAAGRGVVRVADLDLGAIPVDPSRDPGVSALLWEIRRERRLEFAFETFRLIDLRRWKKLEYIDNDLNKDLMSGGWVNFSTELSTELAPKNVNILSVVDLTGKETIYNGSNGGLMTGFYKSQTNKPRLPFLNLANINPYLTPVGLVQMDQYAVRGYVLKQTEGWPQN